MRWGGNCMINNKLAWLGLLVLIINSYTIPIAYSDSASLVKTLTGTQTNYEVDGGPLKIYDVYSSTCNTYTKVYRVVNSSDSRCYLEGSYEYSTPYFASQGPTGAYTSETPKCNSGYAAQGTRAGNDIDRTATGVDKMHMYIGAWCCPIDWVTESACS